MCRLDWCRNGKQHLIEHKLPAREIFKVENRYIRQMFSFSQGRCSLEQYNYFALLLFFFDKRSVTLVRTWPVYCFTKHKNLYHSQQNTHSPIATLWVAIFCSGGKLEENVQLRWNIFQSLQKYHYWAGLAFVISIQIFTLGKQNLQDFFFWWG